MIKRVCTVAWTLLGICAFVMFPGRTDDAEIDQAFGLIAHDLLPGILPGLIGVFIASLLASVMSSCDSIMIACAALFTNNLYRPLTGERRSERHYLHVGRLAAIVTVAGGVTCAYLLENVIQGLEMFWKISAMMGIPFWVGMFWRRATAAGAWASTLAAFAVWYATAQSWFVEWARTDAAFLLFAPDAEAIYLPTQMVLYLSAGLIAMILVSRLTSPRASDELDRFYELLRTPVREGEVIDRPMSLPVDAEPAPECKLIDHPDWEIQRPTARGIVGFLITSAAAAALIGAVMVFVRIGA
jgi:Na+/proline symporter